ncbi:hypothetical protein SAMN02910358_01377 [Lachnospiraceae bacterium XBB1006]|nr:hypothetical protein SAMN02910358_01377 [Lachnospiraceae bacterium XBB1006]
MIGLGTLINTAAIVAGGLVGLVFGKGFKPRFQEIIMHALGISTMFLGIAGTMEKMLSVQKDGTITTNGSMMLIISLAVGALVGEALNLELRFEQLGTWLRKISHSEGDGGFLEGFMTASLTVCIGAMAIVGAIQDGIYKDPTTLIAKAILDFIIIMIMTASMGKGCIFSAVPVFLLQGFVTILARGIEPILTEAALHNLALVGSALIFCVGINLIWGKKIKLANLVPAVIVAVAYAFLPIVG